MVIAHRTRLPRSGLPNAEQVTMILAGLSLAVTTFALGRLAAVDHRTIATEPMELGGAPLRDALMSLGSKQAPRGGAKAVRREVQAP